MIKQLASAIGLAALTLASAAMPAAAQRVVLYSANDDIVNRMVADGFKSKTGITVDIVSAGSGVLLRRIASEEANTQSDIIWGISASLLRQNQKHFQAYAPKGSEPIPAEYRAPDNMWIGTNLVVGAINQNTKAIDRASGPKSWEDLLDPKWKGKIAFTDPANSGFSYTAATMLLSLWGDNDAAWAKLSRLLANTRVLNRSTLVYQGVGTGEYPLSITLEFSGYLWAHNGAPVAVSYPTDGTVVYAEGAAMIKNAPNPDAARAFLDYLASKDAQEMILKATFRRPSRQDIDLASFGAGMPPLSALKILPYDDAKWENERRDTLSKLRTTIQNTR